MINFTFWGLKKNSNLISELFVVVKNQVNFIRWMLEHGTLCTTFI